MSQALLNLLQFLMLAFGDGEPFTDGTFFDDGTGWLPD